MINEMVGSADHGTSCCVVGFIRYWIKNLQLARSVENIDD
jgi:hypothetical protein